MNYAKKEFDAKLIIYTKEPLYLQGYVRHFSNHYVRPDIINGNIIFGCEIQRKGLQTRNNIIIYK